jgi:hypothetical protein
MLKEELFINRIKLYILYVKNLMTQYIVAKSDIINGDL